MPKRIAAIVLAAGMSRRMGRPKALLPLGGLPMIVRVVEPMLATGLVDPILVVTGHQREQVIGAMDGCDVQFVHNRDYENGEMLSSVKAGCRAIEGRCDGFLLALGDQPLIEVSTFRALLESDKCLSLRSTGFQSVPSDLARVENPRYRKNSISPFAITRPLFNCRRGHPILLSANCIAEILALSHCDTLKTFTQRIDAHEIEVDDPGVLVDIDTPEDYERAIAQFQVHRSEPCKQKV